jgi:hypothetical protein
MKQFESGAGITPGHTNKLMKVKAKIEAIGDYEDNLESVSFPHFLYGPLDAKQRLQFLRFHIDRHIGQIRRIESTQAFHSARPS